MTWNWISNLNTEPEQKTLYCDSGHSSLCTSQRLDLPANFLQDGSLCLIRGNESRYEVLDCVGRRNDTDFEVCDGAIHRPRSIVRKCPEDADYDTCEWKENGFPSFDDLEGTEKNCGVVATTTQEPETTAAPLHATSFFISEYSEGDMANRYVELYNAGSSTVYLADFAMAFVSDGSTDGNHEFWYVFRTSWRGLDSNESQKIQVRILRQRLGSSGRYACDLPSAG